MGMMRRIKRKKNMIFSNSENELSFYQWMMENWTVEGGLIPQATAARLMQVSKSRVTQMIKEGKLKELRFENQVFVPYGETMRFARFKTYQDMKEKLRQEMEGLTGVLSPEKRIEFENGITQIIDNAENIVLQNNGSNNYKM